MGLWNEEDGFFYDVLHPPDGKKSHLKVRSMVGLIPLFAVETLDPEQVDRVQRDRAEGLVHLDALDVPDLLPDDLLVARVPALPEVVAHHRDGDVSTRLGFARVSETTMRMAAAEEDLVDAGVVGLGGAGDGVVVDADPADFPDEQARVIAEDLLLRNPRSSTHNASSPRSPATGRPRPQTSSYSSTRFGRAASPMQPG